MSSSFLAIATSWDLYENWLFKLGAICEFVKNLASSTDLFDPYLYVVNIDSQGLTSKCHF